ncbi:hypothetical protein NQ318_008761 [Aromia moschata]|uniref:Uncharacterized protein n=1 Tax=Aromia moschata TaxID=1265417 RepID=A0AAV8ZD44_9CUCU|nr:hypothetical protein NQ318_008761 [Aromia moschata]
MESSKFHIEVDVRILSDQGVLIFIGKTTSGFVCLSLLNGLLELRLHSGKHRVSSTLPLIVRSSKLLVKGIWNKVKFGLFGRKLYLSVDNIINTGVLEVGQMVSISSENVFIGGLPDMSEFPLAAGSGLPIHYTGCIRHLYINDNNVPLTPENVRTARNVVSCNGTPCGGETCLNGGDLLAGFPHCSCVPPYYGDKCEIVPDCDEKMCKNQGRCYNSRCSCNVGWSGAFCEKEIVVKTPEFVGTSYLIIEKGREKKRDLGDLKVTKIYLNFTTVKHDSLLMWSKKDKDFIGIGIEKGLLKLSYSSSQINKTVVEIPFYYILSDDQKLLDTQAKQDNILENITISTDGVFYIGGLPKNKKLMEETNGLFPQAFEGCIEGFGTNADIIRNFGHYEGTNVTPLEQSHENGRMVRSAHDVITTL